MWNTYRKNNRQYRTAQVYAKIVIQLLVGRENVDFFFSLLVFLYSNKEITKQTTTLPYYGGVSIHKIMLQKMFNNTGEKCD